jgi:hypothetical protein
MVTLYNRRRWPGCSDHRPPPLISYCPDWANSASVDILQLGYLPQPMIRYEFNFMIRNSGYFRKYSSLKLSRHCIGLFILLAPSLNFLCPVLIEFVFFADNFQTFISSGPYFLLFWVQQLCVCVCVQSSFHATWKAQQLQIRELNQYNKTVYYCTAALTKLKRQKNLTPESVLMETMHRNRSLSCLFTLFASLNIQATTGAF